MKDMTAEINEINAKSGSAEKASCYVYSSWETKGFIDKMAAGNWNNYYDGLTIHPYCGDPGADQDKGAFYDSAMRLAENVGIQKVKNYVNMLPQGKVPVISEYGIFRSTSPLLRSQTHAVYIAKVLMEYVRLGSPYIQKHCLVDWYSSGADHLDLHSRRLSRQYRRRALIREQEKGTSVSSQHLQQKCSSYSLTHLQKERK